MSKASAKGYRGEVEVQAIFDEVDLPTTRPRAGSPEDKGDLFGVPDLTIQVKNHDDLARSIRDGLAQLVEQTKNTGTLWGVLCVKRRRKGWLAVMPLAAYVALYKEYLTMRRDLTALERLLGKENHHELQAGGGEVRPPTS